MGFINIALNTDLRQTGDWSRVYPGWMPSIHFVFIVPFWICVVFLYYSSLNSGYTESLLLYVIYFKESVFVVSCVWFLSVSY